MRGAITTFWGKLGEELGPAREWHPLLDHCADVAACTEALLTDTLLGERLASWGGLRALDGVQVARLSVISALHDLGKFNYGFQSKSGRCRGLRWRSGRCGRRGTAEDLLREVSGVLRGGGLCRGYALARLGSESGDLGL